ncbi:hypothetical protein H663_001345 [Limnohabitans planktonicus II-D5]|uniref:Uncharacterized protein n=2 Tax=Limnohabitans planktonicus II-D5 TaxID=1293045 RepID=A0A2T7SSS3_9BURK|nr:hypothetical protein H663_020155 [Limnohabitans planktonicus II-D5]PVE41166.1 hypothetical protein H663_018825 [Limnohabitans planktonicus II-D5]PVE44686.1 hypothetical protein H663_001345 [Limnohabitans planktonicus II-D5]
MQIITHEQMAFVKRLKAFAGGPSLGRKFAVQRVGYMGPPPCSFGGISAPTLQGCQRNIQFNCNADQSLIAALASLTQ